jgi:hypothetical protein
MASAPLRGGVQNQTRNGFWFWTTFWTKFVFSMNPYFLDQIQLSKFSIHHFTDFCAEPGFGT